MNGKIAQLVDSAGNLPREIFERYAIKEVPLYFSFDQKHYYRENVDLSNTEFYQYMREHPHQVPKTSAGNVYDWLKGFNELYKNGYKCVIVTTIASHLSASFQNAVQARDLFLESVHDARVEIIETGTCAGGQAALEIKIAQMIQEGHWAWEEIVARTRALVPKTGSLFSVQELTYMKAGGRIGGATAFLGTLMKIKPVCEFVNGVVHPVKAVRGRKKALQQMVEICTARIKNVQNAVIVTQHAICEEDEQLMVETLREKLGREVQIFRSRVGTSVGSHSGPGAIGIGFVGE